ncbi:MAG: lysylphosphatidylglycerol synthase transmembrane domain-containing protein [Planctomycetota bacterium]|nr:lysylphosphatidylglycerol synthase transmembrane domain-containing protein [Planctomycetota bacterium]
MTERTRAIAKLLLRLTITVGLLCYVFRQVDMQHFWQVARTAQWTYLLGVWFFAAVFYGVQSVALRLILRRQGCDVPLAVLFGASSVTALYSLILPGILSTGVKWYILKKHTGKGTNVLSSMLYNQVMLLVAMTVVGLATLIVTNPTRVLFPESRHDWILPVVCAALLTGVVLLCVLLLNGCTGQVVTRSLAVLLRFLPRRMQQRGHDILSQLAIFQNAGLRFHLIVAAVNALDGLLVGLAIYFCAARAAHVTVGLSVLIWLWAAVFVLSKVPITVGNLGVREVTVVGLLTAYGVAQPHALLMSMILFSSQIFLAALGLGYQLVWAIQPKQPPESA